MKNRLLISKWQTIAAVIYAIAFPLSNLIGGGIQTFTLFVTAPFLFLGYFVGWLAVSIFGSPKAYTYGLVLATFIQVWLLLVLWNLWKVPKHESNT